MFKNEPFLMKGEVTITESRVLPGIIGGFLLAFGCVVAASDWSTGMRASVAGCAIAGAVWPLYRCLRPRWVFRFSESKFWFRELGSKQIAEFDLKRVSASRIIEKAVSGVGAEGGIGFETELVLTTATGNSTLNLPFLEVPPAKVLELLRERSTNLH